MKNSHRIFSNISIIKPRKSAAIFLIVLIALFLFPISAAASEFPEGSTFNGMQISYSISGVYIDSTNDDPDFTTTRTLTGSVSEGTVSITATVKQENGYSATISATCGDQTYSKEIQVGESDTFTLSASVTNEMEYISISINMTGYYNAGTRGLVVTGTFKNPNYYNWSEIYSRKLEDAGCVFSDIAGQVEVLNPIGYDINGKAVYDEENWHFAKIDERLYADTRIKTGWDSSAIISFADMSTFVEKERTEIILSSPTNKESKLKLALGNIWVNVKKMAEGGYMEVEMSQAVAGIKGTIFVCEVKEDGTSTLKVIEGEVQFTDKTTGEVTSVTGGEKIAAGAQAMPLVDFDINAEYEDWLQYDSDLVISNKSNSSTMIIISIAALVLLTCCALVFYVVKRKKRQHVYFPRKAMAAQSWNPTPRESVNQSNQPAGQANKKFCTCCGTPVNPGSKFCSGCGAKL